MPSSYEQYKNPADFMDDPQGGDFFMSRKDGLVEVKARKDRTIIISVDSDKFEINVDALGSLFGKGARGVQQILDTPQVGDIIPVKDGRTIRVVDVDDERVRIQIPEDSDNILPVNLRAFRKIIKDAIGAVN